MRKHLRIAGMSMLATLLCIGPANAQVSADGMGKVLPVELFACKFNDGKSWSDLNAVIDQWNEFADDQDVEDYAAWTLVPQFYTTEQDFDFIWMGAYTDFNAMGSGMDMYAAEGDEVNTAFFEVINCPAHILLSSAMYKAPSGDGTPQDSIITMMDCELNEGHRYSDIRDAELKWMEHLAGAGSSGGYWHWFPTYGGGDSEFDYKVVTAFENYSELGATMENFANGGGRAVSMGIFGDIDECDDARVYRATSRRAAQLR